jgi:hypothetical protein
MPIKSHHDAMERVAMSNPGGSPTEPELSEATLDQRTVDGSEETLFDGEPMRDYDLGEGD